MVRRFPRGRTQCLQGESPGTAAVPRRRRGRLALVAGLATCLALTCASPVVADREDRLKDKRQDVNKSIRQAERHLEDSSAELIAAHRALVRARAKLSAARGHLAETRGKLAAARVLDELMQKRLTDAEARLREAEEELRSGQEAVTGAEDELARFVVQSMEFGDPDLVGLGLVLSGDDPTKVTEQIGITDSVTGAQAGTVDRLEAAKALLVIQEERVQAIRDEVAIKRADAAENLERRKELEAVAQEEAAQVAVLFTKAERAEARAERAKARDLRQVHRMERERERIGDMLQRLARKERLAKLRRTPSGGYLSYPVDSYITSSYGMRFHPILHYWKLHDGTDFGAGCGVPIRAAANGTVVSKYYNAGYGNRVIISHGYARGSALATSYNHLSSYSTYVGQHVQRGDIIGYAGTTGYSTGCHLHFMVYVNGVTRDPMGWLS